MAYRDKKTKEEQKQQLAKIPSERIGEDLMELDKPMEYLEFVDWISLPHTVREPKTQMKLSEELSVSEVTFAKWKRRPGFWERVEMNRREWGREVNADVLRGIWQAARDGDAANAKLWLQYIMQWAPLSRRKVETEVTHKPLISDDQFNELIKREAKRLGFQEPQEGDVKEPEDAVREKESS